MNEQAERRYRLMSRLNGSQREWAWIWDNTKDELLSPIFTNREQADLWAEHRNNIQLVSS